MSEQDSSYPRHVGWVAPESGRTAALLLDAALHLGPRPVGLRFADLAQRRLGVAAWRLADRALPRGRFLPGAAPPPPHLADQAARDVLAAAAALPARHDWHGGFDPGAPTLSLALHQGGGARPVWEASRLAALPLLAQAARLDPGGGHLGRAEALLAEWCRANPPFRGIAWACGQEAALRALHLALALALLDADRDPPPAARALLALCARRIAATPFYALAQDNNHPISEAAGAFACALLLGEDTHRHAAALAARVARLVAPDGGFAQISPGYARLALDTLSVAEWLRRRHGEPAFPAPLAERTAALAGWLHRLADPTTGATPPLGVEDSSVLADLSLAGPHDARASLERAARLFAGRGGDAPEDAGCDWLGLRHPHPDPPPQAGEGTGFASSFSSAVAGASRGGGSDLADPRRKLDRPPRWRAAGTMGWQEGALLAVLRTGPLRFRPAQADLLHLSLRDAGAWVIRDGGTGSYDPPATWWWPALAGAAAHNAPVFDGQEPMRRAGRFLLADWPRLEPRPDGAALRDANRNGVARAVRLAGRVCTVEDDLVGPFREVAWHWRLCPGAWRLTADGVEGDAAAIAIAADAPLRLALTRGWESPAYGTIRAVPLLRVTAAAPIAVVTTMVRLKQ